MVDLLEIAESWYRVAIHTPEQKALAEERLAICNGCDQKMHNDVTMMFQCKACGCPIKAKVYSSRGPDACPLQKWPR